MRTHNTLRQALGLFGWLILAFTASAVGAVASVDAGAFYGELAQPTWAPPGWVFGPVWTVLFAFMGIAAWLVWRAGGCAVHRVALGLFVAQLVLNGLWSWLFFAWRLGFWALVDILALIALVSALVLRFWRVRPLAGALLVPYLLWLVFAAALNFTLWQMNPQMLG